MVNGGILLFGGIRARDVPQTIAIFDAMCKINSVLIVVSAESGVLACIRLTSADWCGYIVSAVVDTLAHDCILSSRRTKA